NWLTCKTAGSGAADHTACDDLRIFYRIGNAVNGSGGDAGGIQRRQPFCARARCQCRNQLGLKPSMITRTRGAVGKKRMADQIATFDDFAQSIPLHLSIDANDYGCVFGWKGLERCYQRVSRSKPPRFVAGIEVTRDRIFKQRELRIKHGDIDLSTRSRDGA